MSVQSIGGTAGAASLNFSPLSGANGLQTLNGFHVTGEVTATLPNGMTVGMASFVPAGSGQGQASASSGSSTSSSGGPDYAMMAASVEQMVQAFMNTEFASQASGSPSAAASAAQSAYLQSSTDGSTQGGATGTVA